MNGILEILEYVLIFLVVFFGTRFILKKVFGISG